VLNKRLTPKKEKTPRVAVPVATTSPAVPPARATPPAAAADEVAPTPQGPAAVALNRRVRLEGLVRGICCRARSNVLHPIGRTVVKAWSAGTASDAPMRTGDEDTADERLAFTIPIDIDPFQVDKVAALLRLVIRSHDAAGREAAEMLFDNPAEPPAQLRFWLDACVTNPWL